MHNDKILFFAGVDWIASGESLLEQGFRVYSINPRQLDRFRNRFCVSGAKDDRRDAMVLASALGTDRRHFRRLEPRGPDIIVLRELNRTREELVGERTRLVNRFRGLLWRYYPQFGELTGNTVKPCTQSANLLIPTVLSPMLYTIACKGLFWRRKKEF